jgi:cell pole-organizing protein PopZ
MARRGNLSRNPHLQVGSRLTALFLALALALSSPTAFAASKKPTPKPKVTAKASTKPTSKATTKAKVTAKPSATATAKPSAKVSTKATAKATAKPTTSATAKATKKPTKKPAVKKKKKKKKVRVTPSPKPVWPPKGFSVEGEVYAKVPTAKELVGLISANSSLAKQIKSCTTYICGSVQVASETGCIWWEVLATVTDGEGKKLGELTTAFGKSGAREYKTLIVVSPENVDKGGSAKINSVICHHEDRTSGEPSVSYTKSE